MFPPRGASVVVASALQQTGLPELPPRLQIGEKRMKKTKGEYTACPLEGHGAASRGAVVRCTKTAAGRVVSTTGLASDLRGEGEKNKIKPIKSTGSRH